MAKAIKDAVAEKIELLDQLDETTRHRGSTPMPCSHLYLTNLDDGLKILLNN